MVENDFRRQLQAVRQEWLAEKSELEMRLRQIEEEEQQENR